MRQGGSARCALALVVLSFAGRPCSATCSPDLFEPDDTCFAAAGIQGGSVESRNFCDDGEDWLTFNACSGKTYVLETFNLEAGADTVLDLYGPNCATLLASNDNGGGGLASHLTWVAPASGLYHARVRQADGSSGDGRGYGLRLSGDTSTCTTYVRVYPMASNVVEARAAVTSDGGTVVALNRFPATDPMVYRLDAAGSVVWRKRIGPDLGSATRVFQTSDGGFLLVGGLPSYIVKLTAAGTIAWQKYPVPGVIVDARQTSDGGYIFAGYDSSPGYPSFLDAWVFKLGASGSAEWGGTYDGTTPPDGGEGDDQALAVRQMPDGSYSVLAESSPFYPNSAIWVFRLTPSGGVISQKYYVDAGHAHAMTATSDGGVVFAGWGTPYRLVKLDGSGVTTWTTAFDSNVAVSSLGPTGDGGALVTGQIGVSGGVDAWVARLDGSGVVKWQKRYGQPGATESFDVLGQSPDGGVRLVGWRGGTSPALILVQTDGSGSVQGCSANASASTTTTSVLTIDASMYVTGFGPFAMTDSSKQATTAPTIIGSNECLCAYPFYSGALRVSRVSSVIARVSWTAGGAGMFDVVTGSLGVLRSTGGDFTAALAAVYDEACVADDTQALQIDDGSAVPEAGDGRFYVLRPVDPTCRAPGTYDSQTIGQVEGRDQEIAAAAAACP